MEANIRWALVTAIAPVAWGTNYFVTRQYLPAGQPLYGAAIRALPAGLLLLAVCRARPRGPWWWKSLVLGALNTGGFFALVYLAAQLLPTSTASTVMATSPLVMMLMAWALIGERPRAAHLAGAAVGLGGVGLMLLGGAGPVSPRGVLASAAAMLMSSLGYILAKRWSREVDVLASTCWQLLAGGLLLLPFAAITEGAPPALDLPAALAFGYVTVFATALAFTAWFAGLRHLPAGTVGLVGLLNPATGVLLGTTLAADSLTPRQICGLALTLLGVLLGQARASAPPTTRACFESPACPATPGTLARCVVGLVRVGPLRGRPSALRAYAPDAAGPALRADGATFETRPRSPRPGRPDPRRDGRARPACPESPS